MLLILNAYCHIQVGTPSRCADQLCGKEDLHQQKWISIMFYRCRWSICDVSLWTKFFQRQCYGLQVCRLWNIMSSLVYYALFEIGVSQISNNVFVFDASFDKYFEQFISHFHDAWFLSFS